MKVFPDRYLREIFLKTEDPIIFVIRSDDKNVEVKKEIQAFSFPLFCWSIVQIVYLPNDFYKRQQLRISSLYSPFCTSKAKMATITVAISKNFQWKMFFFRTNLFRNWININRNRPSFWHSPNRASKVIGWTTIESLF